MADYPDTFPCPEVAGYRMDVDMGVIRAQERGHQKQRRGYRTMPMMVNCSFVLATSELKSWQEWMELNAYNWFRLKMVSMYNKPRGDGVTEYHTVRQTSDFSISAITQKHFRVMVEFEMSPVNRLDA